MKCSLVKKKRIFFIYTFLHFKRLSSYKFLVNREMSNQIKKMKCFLFHTVKANNPIKYRKLKATRKVKSKQPIKE